MTSGHWPGNICLPKLIVTVIAVLCMCVTDAKIPLPNFDKLKSVYPGYKHHGGHYSDKDVVTMIGGRKILKLTETTGLRLSFALNKIGHGHEINSYPTELTNLTTYWSTMGADRKIYLTHALAFGPYLAVKYGNPELVRPGIWNRERVMDQFLGRQGLIRIVTYDRRKKAQAFVALWDCNNFYKTRNFNKVLHLLSIEFWEMKGLGCKFERNRKHKGQGRPKHYPKWLR